MVTIIFKNVGHGDTIIVEWRNELGENEMGIIDCHQMGKKSNAAIRHIKKNNYKKIRFIIVEFFDKNYKEIHSTNFVGGFSEYIEYKQSINREMDHQYVNSPLYVLDRQFADDYIPVKDCVKGFECGEKQIKIEENDSITVETISGYS
jgi:hypothetical protein